MELATVGVTLGAKGAEPCRAGEGLSAMGAFGWF